MGLFKYCLRSEFFKNNNLTRNPTGYSFLFIESSILKNQALKYDAFKNKAFKNKAFKNKPFIKIAFINKTLKTTLVSAISAMCLLSPTSQADTIADLIKQKNKPSAHSNQSFSTSNPASPSLFNVPKRQQFYSQYSVAPNIKHEHIATLYNAEQIASEPGKQVLQTVRLMALNNKEIIKGSCWDYLNAAFNRAGVGRDTVFKGQYPSGPFVNTNEIKPGDWLYYVNHSYNGGEHSGLFVGWLNRNLNQALILSYAGENRHQPARYKMYDISHTYNIIRPAF